MNPTRHITLYPEGMNPYQKDFHEYFINKKRFVLMLGGIRAGKTYAGARQALSETMEYGKHGARKKSGLGWIVSPSYSMSRVPERDFEELFRPLIPLRGGHNKTERRYNLLNGWTVEIKTADDPDKLRGPKLDWIWVDEGSMITKHCWDILLGRVMDFKANIWITTTPRGKNWLYEDFYLKCGVDSDYAFVRGSTRDNRFLPQDEVAKLAARYTGEFAEQEIEAEFTSFEGLVMKMFDTFRHVPEKAIPIDKARFFSSFFAGIDFGVSDPCAYVLIGKADARYYVLDEIYEPGLSIEELAARIKGTEKKWGVTKYHGNIRRWIAGWGDSIIWGTELTKHGIGTMTVPEKDVTMGIQTIQYMLDLELPDGGPQLKISPNCANTIKEFGLYQWQTQPDGKVRSGDKPLDQDNHAMDALRYALNSERSSLPQHQRLGSQKQRKRIPKYRPACAVTGY